MNSVSEALNTIISAVNVAHNKGGVYSIEETHFIYLAISFLNSIQNKPTTLVDEGEIQKNKTNSSENEGKNNND